MLLHLHSHTTPQLPHPVLLQFWLRTFCARMDRVMDQFRLVGLRLHAKYIFVLLHSITRFLHAFPLNIPCLPLVDFAAPFCYVTRYVLRCLRTPLYLLHVLPFCARTAGDVLFVCYSYTFVTFFVYVATLFTLLLLLILRWLMPLLSMCCVLIIVCVCKCDIVFSVCVCVCLPIAKHRKTRCAANERKTTRTALRCAACRHFHHATRASRRAQHFFFFFSL